MKFDPIKFKQVLDDYLKSLQDKEKETFLPVGKLAMPERESCVRVGQNELGYLTPDMREKYLLTYGLYTCIGLYTRNSRTNAQFLAHVCGDWSKKARTFLDFARIKGQINSGLLSKEQDLVQILQSPNAPEKNVDEIIGALNGIGHNNIEVLRKHKKNNHDIDISVIYDSDGRMYDLTNIDSHLLDHPVELSRFKCIAFSDTLYLANELRMALEDPLEDRWKKHIDAENSIPEYQSLLGKILFKDYIKGERK